jgi:ketosteroid isomerase-like protein
LFRANDWKGLMGCYAEDAAWLSPNLPAFEGRAAIEAWAATWPRYADYEQHTLEIEGEGDFAYERGVYSMTVTAAGAQPVQERGKHIAIWRRQADGSWKVSRDIDNSDLPFPAATAVGASPVKK